MPLLWNANCTHFNAVREWQCQLTSQLRDSEDIQTCGPNQSRLGGASMLPATRVVLPEEEPDDSFANTTTSTWFWIDARRRVFTAIVTYR